MRTDTANTHAEINLTDEEVAISEKLRHLKMSGMADAFEKQMLNPNVDLKSFMERFSQIVDNEWQVRNDKKFNRNLKKARLRNPEATFDDTLYDPARKLDTELIERLAKCEWIDESRNLLVTGMTGLRKTYISNALCITALRRMKTVLYIKASYLMLELEKARIKSTYLDYIEKIGKLDLLVIDDFGLMDLDQDKCRDLFEVIDSRDGRKSTIVISQLPVKSWFDIFKEHTYADAVLSRLTDKRHSLRLEMNGISMRA